MNTIIAVIQNFIQLFLDVIFVRIVVILRKCLFNIFQSFLQKNKKQIEDTLINTDLNPVNDGLSILALTSITNSLGIVANNTFEQFFFSIPDEYRSQLNEYKFYINGDSDRSSKYYSKLTDFLVKYYSFSIDEAYSLISKHRDLVAQQFLDEIKTGKQKSNNKMFGVDRISNRGNLLELQLFVTDYFSYTCMNRIYRYLKSTYPDNKSLFVQTIDDVNKVSPLLCDFGVGGFLSLNHANKEVYFVGKRSSSVACPNVWQTSFDETFDLRDKPNLQGASPNLKTCLERGVKEELGFFVSEHGFRIETSLLSVIQTEERFELELFVIGHCMLKKMGEFEDIILQMYSASDFENENEMIELIPQEDVESFFEGLKNKGEEHTIEAKNLWLAFMNIRNKQNMFNKLMQKLEL